MATHTYRGHIIHPADARARANGWRWEALTSRGWVYATSLAGIKDLIRDTLTR